jgi:hypothetical protein
MQEESESIEIRLGSEQPRRSPRLVGLISQSCWRGHGRVDQRVKDAQNVLEAALKDLGSHAEGNAPSKELTQCGNDSSF